jgi:hypothetical protein
VLLAAPDDDEVDTFDHGPDRFALRNLAPRRDAYEIHVLRPLTIEYNSVMVAA